MDRIEYDGTEYFLLEELTTNDMPEEMRYELNYLGDLGEDKAWGTAKRVHLWLDMMHAEGIHPQMMQLYAIVGQEVKSGSETVRMHYGVWKEIPREVYRAYTDGDGKEIGFHQFKALVPKLRDQPASEWFTLIERWFGFCADNQRHPASVDGMRSWLAGEFGAPSPAVGRHRRIMGACKKQAQDQAVPEPLRKLYARFIELMVQACDTHSLGDWVIED